MSQLKREFGTGVKAPEINKKLVGQIPENPRKFVYLLQHWMAIRKQTQHKTFSHMVNNVFFQVPDSFDSQALFQAFKEGRLYVAPVTVSAVETRAQVLNIVARIHAYASAQSLVINAWEALLADDDRARSFCTKQKRSAAWISGSGAALVNRYRITAIVRYMCENGLYNMQLCNTANQTRGFRGLCQLLFFDENEQRIEQYRRGCGNYAYYEDEVLIDQIIKNFSMEGCRYE